MIYRSSGQKTRRILAVVGLIAALVGGYLFLTSKPVSSPPTESPSQQDQVDQTPTEPEKPAIVDIQPTLDEWAARQTGKFSVVVYDPENNQLIGEKNKDQVYFAASLYKLYVAYEGYLAAQNDDYSLDEVYLNGQTRKQCLDKMIRESDSPCAEKLWNELGKEATTQQLKTYGIDDTSMTGITTTAQDAATILARIWSGTEINQENRQTYLDSMKTQPELYRRGLPSGFSTDITVYNKVGWNLDKEWHDTAIISLPNGRNYIITVLTENVGMTQIAALASQLETTLNTN